MCWTIRYYAKEKIPPIFFFLENLVILTTATYVGGYEESCGHYALRLSAYAKICKQVASCTNMRSKYKNAAYARHIFF